MVEGQLGIFVKMRFFEFFVMPLVMGDEVYKNDELLCVRMVLDAQIVVRESNGSDVCIWSEFVKVGVFFYLI